jgi:hypothetical protein
MKTIKLFLCLVVMASGFTPYAQLKINGKETFTNNTARQKNLQLKQASDNIKKASIPKMKTPVEVQLDLALQMKKIKEQCPYLQSQRPTLHLEGERISNSLVDLEWETTNGWNNRTFTLERSLGDSFHFETITQVEARSIAAVKDRYQNGDDNTFNKFSYYRVKLLLKDGNYLFSNIATVDGYVKAHQFLYPNPAVSGVTVSIFTETPGQTMISLYDAAGKMVNCLSTTLVAGNNNKQVDLNLLSNGFYTVKITLPDKSEKTLRLVKQ